MSQWYLLPHVYSLWLHTAVLFLLFVGVCSWWIMDVIVLWTALNKMGGQVKSICGRHWLEKWTRLWMYSHTSDFVRLSELNLIIIQQIHLDSSSGNYEYLYNMSWQSILEILLSRPKWWLNNLDPRHKKEILEWNCVNTRKEDKCYMSA